MHYAVYVGDEFGGLCTPVVVIISDGEVSCTHRRDYGRRQVRAVELDFSFVEEGLHEARGIAAAGVVADGDVYERVAVNRVTVLDACLCQQQRV